MTHGPQLWRRVPGQGRYALAEVERRFLVTGVFKTEDQGRLIEDLYLDGLRLRLRRVTKDGHSVFKLTQKVRADESDPTSVSITNMYLSNDEYERLCLLPGAALVKTRRAVLNGPTTFVVDEFGGSLTGLVLAEVEVVGLQDALEIPRWLGSEVTFHDRFSGERLARASDEDIHALLSRANHG